VLIAIAQADKNARVDFASHRACVHQPVQVAKNAAQPIASVRIAALTQIVQEARFAEMGPVSAPLFVVALVLLGRCVVLRHANANNAASMQTAQVDASAKMARASSPTHAEQPAALAPNAAPQPNNARLAARIPIAEADKNARMAHVPHPPVENV
jgi:hypothetical protein